MNGRSVSDILQLQNEYNSFWNWMSINIQNVIDQSNLQKGIIDNFRCKSLRYRFDITDLVTISLVNQTLSHHNQSAFLLPDNKKSRPTMLFANLLISQWLQMQKEDNRNSKLLFIGSSSLIRRYFQEIQLVFPRKEDPEQRPSKVLPFSGFFPKLFISKDGQLQSQDGIIWDVFLPQIICYFSPVNPRIIVENQKPDCIVINFEHEQKDDPWVSDLIKISKEKNIPLIAFIQNSLSNSLTTLEQLGVDIFYWPRYSKQNIPNIELIKRGEIELSEFLINFYEIQPISITPIVVESHMHWFFAKAYVNLCQARDISDNELTKAAVKIGSQYLRLLEELPVPLNIYESECSNHWGLKRISRMKEAFDKFLVAIESPYPDVFNLLNETSSYLDKIYDDFSWNVEPDLWMALQKIIQTDVPENEIFIIAFKTISRKKLFELAISLQLKITSEELEDQRIFITCLKEMKKTLEQLKYPESFNKNSIGINNKKIHVTIVGLPNIFLDPYLEETFFQNSVDILLYSHLKYSLEKRANFWNNRFSLPLLADVKILGNSLTRVLPCKIPLRSDHIFLKKPEIIQSKIRESPIISQNEKDEISSLQKFKANIEDVDFSSIINNERDDDEQYVLVDNDDSIVSNYNYEEVVLESAIKIEFVSGHGAFFAPNDILKVINPNYSGNPSEFSTIESPACKVQPGDKILYIQGQKRQSLYALLLSRIHEHPSVKTKLDLIQRWHNEFAISFDKKQELSGFTFEDLLNELRQQGSDITTTQTLYSWLYELRIAPLDKDDLKRLADILDMKFVKKYYKEIFIAARYIRGIHSGFANKLNHWLLEQAKGIVQNDKNLIEYIDEDLGITLDDFKESLVILSVKSVESKNGLFYRDDLGKLEV
jgi:hypothetical protein